MSNKKKEFKIVFPPMWAYLVVGLGIVYNWKFAWETFGLLTIFFTILELL